MRKNEKGITLVALVVTVVVLLILAGVTISFVLSDGGLFGKAQNLKYDSARASISDYMTTAITSVKTENAISSATGTTPGYGDGSEAQLVPFIQKSFGKGFTCAAGTGLKVGQDGYLEGTMTVTVADPASTFTVDFTSKTVKQDTPPIK